MNLAEEIRAAGISAALPPLPLVHTQAWGALKKRIPSDCRLDTIHSCPVEPTRPALCMFYGLPAYRLTRPESPGQSMEDVVSRPVALIFRDAALGDRVADAYPFDTGAVSRNRYAPVVASNESLLPYRLTGCIRDCTGKLVSHLFGGNREYVDADPRRMSDFKAESLSHKVAKVYWSAGATADDRRLTIEVVLGQPISIDSDSLEAIIAPNDLKECGLFADFLRVTRVAPTYYHARQFYSSDGEVAVLIDRALEYYESAGYLKT